MADVRATLQKPQLKPFIAVIAIIAIAAAAWAVWSTVGGSAAARIAQDRAFMCAQTGKAFEHKLQIGQSIPVESPYSGKKTGYPAEPCFWTADGGTRPEPTFVLLKKYTGSSDPTFCPDCKRMVVGLNPAPEPGRKPPITEQEYLARNAQK